MSFHLPSSRRVALPMTRARVRGGDTAYAIIGSTKSSPSIARNTSVIMAMDFDGRPSVHFLRNRKIKQIALPKLKLRVKRPTVGHVPQRVVVGRLSTLCSGKLSIAVSIPKKGRLTRHAFGPGLKVISNVSVVKASNVIHPFSSRTFIRTVHERIRIYITINSSELVVGSKTGDRHFIGGRCPKLPTRTFMRCKGFVKRALGVTTGLGIPLIALNVVVNGTIGLTRKGLSARDGGIIVGGRFLERITVRTKYSPSIRDVVRGLALTHRL